MPTEDAQVLADFKGLRTPLRASPALQSNLSAIPGFEGYDPNRDISTARNVDMGNIKHVDVIDPGTQKATRYFLDSYSPTKLTMGQRAKALGKTIAPLAFAGLGANMLYRGVSNRKGALGKVVRSIKQRLGKKDDKKNQKKTASKFTPFRDAAKTTLTYGVPLMALGAGQGILTDKIQQKILPVTDREINTLTAADEIHKTKRETVRKAVGIPLSMLVGLGGAGILGLAGSRAGRKYIQRNFGSLDKALEATSDPAVKKRIETMKKNLGSVGALGGAYAGFALGGMGTGLGKMVAQKRKMATRGDDPLREELGETREQIAKDPNKSMILPGLLGLGIMGGTIGAAKKYYPGMIRKMKSDMVFKDRVPGMDLIRKASGVEPTAKIVPDFNVAGLLPETAAEALEDYVKATTKGQGASPEVVEYAAQSAGGAVKDKDANMLEALDELGALGGRLIGGDGSRSYAQDLIRDNPDLAADLLKQTERKQKASKQILDNLGLETFKLPVSYKTPNVNIPVPKNTEIRKTDDGQLGVEGYTDIADALRRTGLYNDDAITDKLKAIIGGTNKARQSGMSNAEMFKQVMGAS